ncbi:MFS transporter [Lactobacillus sp. UCMA15818]|uniref:MFS transporter n=1 Tax=Lactobacillus sp. UCMA15818 TaxID=2583394 RepID=UPI0025B13C9F|nr:MFS transporter [Lactobacillus sp. UCMA15818]MDN2452957.1 MFS transporter [Lactobacillus sp. UCMA15818]
MKNVKDKLGFKVSLLSISLFLMIAPQISSALPLMYHAFPGVSSAGVDTLATIPNFGIVIGLLISPFIVRFISAKPTIIIGLLITLVAGTFPMYSDEYVAILTSRLLLGLGIGLFNSLAVSLIPEFYKNDEEELAVMIGYQNVMGSVGAALASFLLSYLVTISWHAAFAIYFLVLPSLILFILFVPLSKNKNNVARTKKDVAEKQSINGRVVLISLLMFLIFMFYMPVSFALPGFIVSEKIGTSSTAALIAGISTLVGIPIGASFGFFFKKLHDKVFPLGFALVAFGFLLIAMSHNFALLFIAVIILGFGFGIGVPYMYTWLDWAAPWNSINLGTTIVLVLVNIGCFISPTVISAIESVFGMSSARDIMILSAGAFALIFIFALMHYVGVHRQQKNSN